MLVGSLGASAVWGLPVSVPSAGQVTYLLPSQPDLAANEAQLLRKIQLLCLMEVSERQDPLCREASRWCMS